MSVVFRMFYIIYNKVVKAAYKKYFLIQVFFSFM